MFGSSWFDGEILTGRSFMLELLIRGMESDLVHKIAVILGGVDFWEV